MSGAAGEQASFAKSRADDLARLIMAATDRLSISARAEGVDGISDVAGILGAWLKAAAAGDL